MLSKYKTHLTTFTSNTFLDYSLSYFAIFQLKWHIFYFKGIFWFLSNYRKPSIFVNVVRELKSTIILLYCRFDMMERLHFVLNKSVPNEDGYGMSIPQRAFVSRQIAKLVKNLTQSAKDNSYLIYKIVTVG